MQKSIKNKMRGTLGRQDKIIKCYYNPNGCLISTSHTLGNDGYPQIQREKKRWRLSRWIFYNNYGWLPEIVMHSCDNPLCINPLNLRPGTVKENSLLIKQNKLLSSCKLDGKILRFNLDDDG